MNLQTKEALKSDYKVLMNKIDNQLEAVEGTFRKKKSDLKVETSEKVKMLEQYRDKLKKKYEEMNETSAESFERMTDSLKSTYNDALNNLGDWLDNLKTKN